MLAVDESYFAKNAAAARTRALHALRPYCQRAIVLCGTPAPNHSWDVVSQVSLTDEGIAFGARPRPKDPEDARSAVIEGLQGALYLRRLKRDVLPELPGQTVEVVRVEMTPRQRVLYDDALDALVLEVQSVTDETFRRNLSSYISRRVVLLQICSIRPWWTPCTTKSQPSWLRSIDWLPSSLTLTAARS